MAKIRVEVDGELCGRCGTCAGCVGKVYHPQMMMIRLRTNAFCPCSFPFFLRYP